MILIEYTARKILLKCPIRTTNTDLNIVYVLIFSRGISQSVPESCGMVMVYLFFAS